MTTDKNIEEMLRMASDVVNRARIHSALLADVVSAVSEIIGDQINLFQRPHSKSENEPVNCMTFYIEGTNRLEHNIYIPTVSPSNLDHVRLGIAHELGHILLGRSPDGLLKSRALSPDEEEKLANVFAIAIVSHRGKVKEREKMLEERPKDLLNMIPELTKADIKKIINIFAAFQNTKRVDQPDGSESPPSG
jgi:hypothetical protein